MNRIYLDHAATTPVAPEVIDCMSEILKKGSGNPSSVHRDGQHTRIIVEQAREQVAAFINADPAEIVFTSGGTEADNLAVIGAAMAMREKGRHIISTRLEHPAVSKSLDYLSSVGFEIQYLECETGGMINPGQLQQLLRDDTILLSVMLVNNETGNILPLKKIAEIIKDHPALLHTDAVQAAGKIPLDVNALAVDLLSLSAHKINGPSGIGALYVRRGTPLEKQVHGGAQESGRRSGTENLTGIAGFAAAVQLPQISSCAVENMRVVQQLFEDSLHGLLPDCEVNGVSGSRSASVSNIFFPGVAGDSLLLSLDMNGLSASSGSACSSGSIAPSAVLQAMGYSTQRAASSIRFSFGHKTSKESVEKAVQIIAETVLELRQKESLNAR